MIAFSDFVRLVVQMRSAQKDFFINHSQQALTRAKQLEKRVDAAALELLNAQPQQVNLFPEPISDSVKG